MIQPGAHLELNKDKLAELCIRRDISELALFGSYARGDFGPGSDVDIMVTFAPGRKPNLWKFVSLRDELQSLFGRPVDVIVKGTIHNPFRLKSIERDLTTLYAA